MFANDVQKQSSNEENIYDQNLSTAEKLSDGPLPPAPGVEDLRASDLPREFNPNTE
jgi:hypothetical protein